MDNDYTPPNEMCERLQHVVDLCQSWIKLIRRVEGTSEEKDIMVQFNAVDFLDVLRE